MITIPIWLFVIFVAITALVVLGVLSFAIMITWYLIHPEKYDK